MIEKVTDMVSLDWFEKQKPSYTKLIVNGYVIGEYIQGEYKGYLNPIEWADKQSKKRLKVLDRNITRLENEASELAKERAALEEYAKSCEPWRRIKETK